MKKFINLTSPILIRGETGTGKSFLAHEIFSKAHVHKDAFLTVHLASLKEDLLESELFGHKRGAFTGALENKSGYLKDVGRGTLFLDEIGELSLDAQKKLLYLLEEKKFTPVGSTHPIAFEGRIIMATNKNLEQMVKEKTFREDLYFRMSVFQIELKPLHLDLEKLNSLIEHLFTKLKTEHRKFSAELTPELKKFLLNHQWAGNVRELKNSLEYALVMAETNYIRPSDLPLLQTYSKRAENNSGDDFFKMFDDDFNASLEKFEQLYLGKILDKYQGKVNLTARKLGISKTTLIAKAKKYGINTLRLRANASEVNDLAA